MESAGETLNLSLLCLTVPHLEKVKWKNGTSIEQGSSLMTELDLCGESAPSREYNSISSEIVAFASL